MTVRGWHPGFNKARFTRLVRDGGLPLGASIDATAHLLAGERVTLRLAQFTDAAAARTLADIGVAETSTDRADAA